MPAPIASGQPSIPPAAEDTPKGAVQAFLRAGARETSQHRHVRGFIALWKELSAAAGGRVPDKADFTMRRLKPYLESYFLAEWTGDDLVNRLVGSSFDEKLSAGLTGQSFFRHYSGAQHDFFHAFWHQIVDHPCGVLIARTLVEPSGRTLRLEGVDLPLADSRGNVRFICGIGDVATVHRHDSAPVETRQVFIDHVEYLDLGFGLPATAPDPALFNAANTLLAPPC